MSAIRVVLADDHALVRRGMRAFFEETSDIQVVAEADDGDKALALVETTLFDQRPWRVACFWRSHGHR